MVKSIGKYILFLGSLFVNRESFKTYFNLVIYECVAIGISSIMIVSLVSIFIGAVTAIQTAYNMTYPFVPRDIIAYIVREMELLELAPTFTAIVFAGKVGSNIASELGTMRITEQIDAIDVMGINSSSYLVLPKIIATTITYPLLVIFAIALGLFGGYLSTTLTGELTPVEYINGIRLDFAPYNIYFALIKSVIFGFLISSISAFKGYFTYGGALEVGKASTSAVTNSCIAVLCADYLLAQLLLNL
ncbi:MlaE family ABC transporter permease [Aureibacter tunicatorum]|uniref:Phospholipid/cholesterol/gamma-HCH transport system permease protein n=1 Tax=Aureibacter tunicatorum TaxID=866807 RepID=A0AAE3XN92_9BACT|nr:ABC transporter permease [Aureibacter tunicatorum]MDR6239009.1 phospholipid/cholesterol/gamma-HCH transport system permease protein [Aureibacter tunicatorum]BDD05065.1 ABC transporter permease [Aureibacter tunicatorum]